MKPWRLKRTAQCAKCPWRVASNPHAIPNSYSESKHRRLADTIAKPGDITTLLGHTIKVMACHESHDAHCVGWLNHQLGDGNNLPLRLSVRNCQNLGKLRLRGAQHTTFEETLP